MAFIDWSRDLSVEVEEIDDQHKKLLRLINELADAMDTGKTKASLRGIIEGLAKYTVTHFTTEERYFKEFGFAATAFHKKEHDSFVKKIYDFKRDIVEGHQVPSFEVLKFLKDWLINHIKGTDKKYTSCFHENGLR